MTYIGIDPGRKGAMAIITEDKIKCFDMPLKKNNEIDIFTLLSDIWKYCDDENLIVILEKAQAMPGQGITSSFNYGVGYGEIRGLLKALNLDYIEIHPLKWKHYFKLTKKANESIFI